MFSDVHLKNFGAFTDFRWSEHGRVNVVVGENDTGKSYLLRMMYAMVKTIESAASRNIEPDETRGVFLEKLRWTFQPSPDISALVRNGADVLEAEAEFTGREYAVVIPKRPDGTTGLPLIKPFSSKRGTKASAIFLPPKEVLTIFAAIAVSRDLHEIYGFDDTYNDLVKLLRVPPTQGKIVSELESIIAELETFYDGQIVKVGITDEFLFVRGERSYTMPQTADGIKKLGILTTLLKSRSIKPGTVLFVDEPETNLHPRAIAVFTNMLFRLGQAGVQVYLATHSYFVLKQLEILAKQHQTSVPFCSLRRAGSEIEARFSDLREGMPDNPIIDESLRLYQRGIDVDMRR